MSAAAAPEVGRGRRLQRWCAPLFPAAGPISAPRGLVVGGYLVALVVLSLVALARQSGVPATNTVWAEDGTLFYAQALRSSFWHTLWTPYNGYAQLVPRVIAGLASAFPVTRASEVMSVCGAVSLAAIACCVFHMARGHIRPAGLRALLAAAIMLLPVATAELLDNAVNVPWWLFFAAFWALLWRPGSGPGRGAAMLIGFLGVASDPLVLLFAPLGLLRAFALRSWKEHFATAGMAVGLLYQIAARTGAKETTFRTSMVKGLGQDLAVRLGLGLVAGDRATSWVAAHNLALATALGTIVLAGVLAVGVTWGPSRLFATVATAISLLCFLLPVWLRAVSVVMLDSPVSTGSRYDAVPLLILVSVLLVCAGAALEGGPRRAHAHGHAHAHSRASAPAGRAYVVTGLLLVLLVPTWVADFRDANGRTTGPSWPAQVTAGTRACLAAHPRVVNLAIDPAPWVTPVPCRRLVGPGTSAAGAFARAPGTGPAQRYS